MNDFKKKISETYPYKIELHCHNLPVSQCASVGVDDIVRTYYSEGYSGIVTTNHLYPVTDKKVYKNDEAFDDTKKAFIENYNELKKKAEALGIRVYLGVEIRLPENNNDYLIYGIDESFILNLQRDCKTIAEFYKKYKTEDNIILQAHPFRSGMELCSLDFIDGIEVFNMHPNHNSRIAFASKYAEEMGLVSTVGSDYHHQGQGALSAMLTKELPKDSVELAKIIKSGDCAYKIGKAVMVF